MDKCPHCNAEMYLTRTNDPDHPEVEMGYIIVGVESSREITEDRDPQTGKILRLIPGPTHTWVRIRMLDGTEFKTEVPNTKPSPGEKSHYIDAQGDIHCNPWL
jgi:hypothetical protein